MPQFDSLKGKHILFACVPGDGHFNPLTGLARHLQSLGCDVRWYASYVFEQKLQRLGIRHYKFIKALDVPTEKIDEVFPQRKEIKGQIKKLNFDMLNYFILRGPEYIDDMKDINREWKIDAVVADCLFPAIPFVKWGLNVPVVSIGVVPLIATSRDLAPAGLGMEPAPGLGGRIKHELLKVMANKVLFKKPNAVFYDLLRQRNIASNTKNAFEALVEKASVFLQSGTPGFEYKRSDLGGNIHYIGPLLPYSTRAKTEKWYDERLKQYKRVILVTQGTVEKDTTKLLVPSIEAFKDTDVLLVVTTGGSDTEVLRKAYPQKNVIIEDFISFEDIMPFAQVYISNGGFGGVQMGIQHGLPMVVAGVHEGKNEINARINHHKFGINIGTETPTAAQIKDAVNKIATDTIYRDHVAALRKEFSSYHPNEILAGHLQRILN